MRGEHRLACSTPIERQGSSPHARGALERGRHRRNWRGIIPACAGSTARAPWCNWRLRDHPRMRGEHTSRLCSLWQSLGSSPHARGAPRACRHAACQAGIIPACAGSTSTPRWSATTRRDHPRMRGEHRSLQYTTTDPVGSSPHARGAPGRPGREVRVEGIIPACAGSTRTTPQPEPCSGDHPRMRGEHVLTVGSNEYHVGSSPHARGALGGLANGGVHEGIIPACAGSTDIHDHIIKGGKDHPRMRGEHQRRRSSSAMSRGSSPHARGALRVPVAGMPRRGIIPACAGSTAFGGVSKTVTRDHPRMRGEHLSHHRMVMTALGSSPHARGALGSKATYGSLKGIIPACAGSTKSLGRIPMGCGDHPRMRGEHCSTRTMLEPCAGSSPHARGAPPGREVLGENAGIIPACAGSTLAPWYGCSCSGDHPRMRGEHT